MSHQLIETDAVSEADLLAIRTRLRAFNLAATKYDGPSGSFAVLIKDGAGETVGGVTTHYGYDWMFVEFLVVPEDMRGQGLGRELMIRVEAHAGELGLTGIWLDTFSFQAPDFYRSLGFEEFGAMEQYPAGFTRHYLAKRL